MHTSLLMEMIINSESFQFSRDRHKLINQALHVSLILIGSLSIYSEVSSVYCILTLNIYQTITKK